MAKAGLTVTRSHITLRDVTEDVLMNTPEKKDNLAAQMGKDRAQMYRQAKSGHLTVADLAALGPEFAVRHAQAVLDQLGPLATPQARARQTIRELRRAIDELEQLVEHVA